MSGGLKGDPVAPSKNAFPSQELPHDICRMTYGKDGQSESNKITQIYSDFMTRITKFEELLSVGNRLLVGFQQALGFLSKLLIDKNSTLVDCIIKAHGSKRFLSYLEAGCIKAHDSMQCVSKLHACHLGLQDHIDKAKTVVDELECLLDDAASVVHTAREKDKDVSCNLVSAMTSSDELERPSSDLSKSKVTDYATMMAIVFSMVKQDYTMQVRIVSSLNLKSSPEELETYCQMWSLRPFLDDDIMRKAWSLVS